LDGGRLGLERRQETAHSYPVESTYILILT
jgi:hypothetical protein